MIVKELKAALEGLPEHLLVFYQDSERGNMLVGQVFIEDDTYHQDLEVAVIGRKRKIG